MKAFAEAFQQPLKIPIGIPYVGYYSTALARFKACFVFGALSGWCVLRQALKKTRLHPFFVQKIAAFGLFTYEILI